MTTTEQVDEVTTIKQAKVQSSNSGMTVSLFIENYLQKSFNQLHLGSRNSPEDFGHATAATGRKQKVPSGGA